MLKGSEAVRVRDLSWGARDWPIPPNRKQIVPDARTKQPLPSLSSVGSAQPQHAGGFVLHIPWDLWIWVLIREA